MKTVNSISGGKTSAYIAANYPADYDIFALVRSSDESVKFKDRKLAQEVEDRIQKPFVGTLEDDIIIHTIFDLEQFTGRRITWVSGITFDEVIDKKGGMLPSFMRRFCTTEMKMIPIKDWWNDQINETVEMRIGFRANELRRAKNTIEKCNENGFQTDRFIIGKSKKNNKWADKIWRKPSFPLIEDGIFQDNINNYWKNLPVRFAPINNCVGCFHGSPLKLLKMWDWHPEKMEWFAKQEKKNKGTFKEEGDYESFKGTGLLDLFPEDFGGNDGCESGYCGI